eukprot:m.76854 g.76854  ORF g.76854 m.76854 type:complete len:494 (-) comp24943_c0_seq2:135-1616(-)
MASIGFIANLLLYRNASRKGETYGFKYPVNPKQLEKMGPKWITKALRASKTIGVDIEVISMTAKVPEIIGLMGDLRVVDLVYNKESDAPKKVMVKFASGDFDTRALNALFGFIKGEYKFYSGNLPSEVPMRVPKVFYADMNMWTGNMCLILEFVADGEFLTVHDKGLKLKIEDVKLMVGSIAKLHAKFHGNNINAPSAAWVPRLDEGPIAKLAPKEFLKRFGAVYRKELPCGEGQSWTYEIPPEFAAYHEDFGKHFLLYEQHSCSWPHAYSVVHGDDRLDNWWFYTNESGQRACGLLDWQMIAKGGIMSDLTWMFCCSLDPETLTLWEEKLLDHYFEEFAKAGGPKVEPGSEDRRMYEEAFDLELTLLLAKNVIGLGSMDIKNTAAVPQLNFQMNTAASVFARREAHHAWHKFRNCDLICQKRYPDISTRLFTKAKMVPRVLEGSTYKQADLAASAQRLAQNKQDVQVRANSKLYVSQTTSDKHGPVVRISFV